MRKEKKEKLEQKVVCPNCHAIMERDKKFPNNIFICPNCDTTIIVKSKHR